ncbi:MAG: CBS domain-containing protein [Acidobacteria bacterium]|nr:CBS domain-containing protein [Acidobacteriota bacterium]
MTRDVVVVTTDMEIHELEKIFLEKKIHGAPVADASGKLVGVVSQTDLLMWHFENGVDGSAFYHAPEMPDAEGVRALHLTDIHTARVVEVMTPLVHAIRETSPASEAAERMIRHRIHRLVVVDEALHVRGVISAMDLLKLLPGVRS